MTDKLCREYDTVREMIQDIIEPPFIDIPIEDAIELGFDINDGVPLFEDGSYYRFYRPDIKEEIEKKKRGKNV